MNPYKNKGKKSANERLKEHRAKIDADPERKAKQLELRRAKYKLKKEEGKIKTIKDLSQRAARRQRKQWRDEKRNQRQINKNKKTAENSENAQNSIQSTPSTSGSICPSSSQKKKGRRNIRKDRAKCYRENKRLTFLVKKKDKQLRRIQKQLQRCKMEKRKCPDPSPRSKVHTDLAKFSNIPKTVRKTLIFHTALVDSIRSGFRNIRSHKLKKILATKLLSLKILKKYRLQKLMKQKLEFSNQRLSAMSKANQKLKCKNKDRQEIVKAFYLQDDVSRLANGKKLTITKNKLKMQKRFLNDNLSILHAKFLTENPQVNISYTQFTRLRPFWVLFPKEKDRDTCMCKACENFLLLSEKLKQEGVITFSTITQIPHELTCNVMTKECAYKECVSCKDTDLEINNDYDKIKEVTVAQWVTKKEERQKINVKDGTTTTIFVNRTVKLDQAFSLYDLVMKFHTASKRYTRHYFNIVHQYKEFRVLKNKLGRKECIMQIDFSENYSLKYANQVQDAHFGASLQQASLHTGVIHVLGREPISFVSISPNLQHGPPAIWAHLEPPLDYIKVNFPAVKTIHFFSDGPATQYRQKGNFYLFSTKLYEKGYEGTWNFWESGHGRGAPDGVGGAIKRRADNLVHHGTDLPSAEILYDELQKSNTSIQLFFISEEAISAAFKTQPQLKTIPKTMSIHQVTTVLPANIEYNELSCFCQYPEVCSCFQIGKFAFTKQQDEKYDGADYANLNTISSLIQPVDTLSHNLIDKWVVIKYEGCIYPGKVVSVDEVEVTVNSMSCSGRANKYFWPKPEDIMPFYPEEILTMMSEPNKLQSGHIEIPPALYTQLTNM